MSDGVGGLGRQRPLVARAAPFWRRLAADVVDLALLLGCGWLLWWGGVIRPDPMPPQVYDWVDYTADLLANHLVLFRPAAVLVPLVGLLYAVLTRALLGATLGERLCGLRLVRRDGERAGPIGAALHAVGTALGVATLLLGYLWAAVDRQRQGLAEYVSGTILVVGAVAAAPVSRDVTL